MEPLFLDLPDVVRIHVDQINHYGGLAGIRDLDLLQSAVAMPKASFGGEYLHRDFYEMAAAYAFHISQDQPFVDGNKRTALASALVFLDLNGIYLEDPGPTLYQAMMYQAMMDVSTGDLDKAGLAALLRRLQDNH